MDGNPNTYTRRDVIALAKIIDFKAWNGIEDGAPEMYASDACRESISTAARILIAGYRDCTIP
jgi:hypothetical protein